ncbi:hypothetical protein [Paraburkholderia sp. EG304]|uniref:hypothetical protein n=1 Tax=Paraburkholderia sp. EG304 TaxID=3237015 RepID=UPI00397BCA80
METLQILVRDTNDRAKGLRPISVERDASGEMMSLEYAGDHYHFSRTGTNIATNKPMVEFAARGNALRLWVAEDLSFAQED